jgi:hypothetical protein
LRSYGDHHRSKCQFDRGRIPGDDHVEYWLIRLERPAKIAVKYADPIVDVLVVGAVPDEAALVGIREKESRLV